MVSECDATLSAYENSLDQAHAWWVRVDKKSKAFMTTRKGGAAWKHVKRCVTVDLGTNQAIEDIDVNASVEDAWLHRQLPEGVSGTRTLLYHDDPSVAGGEPSVSASHAGKPSDVSVELLEKIWRIDSEIVKRTIKTTTQLCRQDMDSKLST